MMHGIWFDDIHSFEDLNLVLSKTNIPPAKPKTNYIEIPGGDGSADLTEAIGDVKFQDRECSFTFTVFPYEDFEEKKREISNLLNGKRCKIVLDKDPDYYWLGRCSVNDYASDGLKHEIVIGAKVAPYKLKHDVTKVIVPSAGGNMVAVNLSNSRKKVIPTFTNLSTFENAYVYINGNPDLLMEGETRKFYDIELAEGFNQIIVAPSGSGDVVITYQEGDL